MYVTLIKVMSVMQDSDALLELCSALTARSPTDIQRKVNAYVSKYFCAQGSRDQLLVGPDCISSLYTYKIAKNR